MWTKWCSIIGMLCVACALAALFTADQASGQMVREPRIEGVSYSEIAQWQQTYGRGPFFRGGYGPGFCETPPVIEYCEIDEPPALAPKPKNKKRSTSK
ncbi:MAG: hypothetical protein ACPL7J_01610 [Desulfomonilaceae bacterium]